MPKRLLGQPLPIFPLKRPLQLRAHAPLVATPMPNNPAALSTGLSDANPQTGFPQPAQAARSLGAASRSKNSNGVSSLSPVVAQLGVFRGATLVSGTKSWRPNRASSLQPTPTGLSISAQRLRASWPQRATLSSSATMF